MPHVLLLPLLILALAATTSAAAERASVTVGNATVAYDPDRWQVRSWTDGPVGAAATRHLFYCIAPECFDRPFASVSAEPRPDGINDGTWLGDLAGSSRDAGPLALRSDSGVRFQGASRYGGCRAYTPAARHVSAVAGGMVYTFATGTNFGCGGIEGVPREMLAELVAGFALSPDKGRLPAE